MGSFLRYSDFMISFNPNAMITLKIRYILLALSLTLLNLSASNALAQNTARNTSLSLGYYVLDNLQEGSDSFYTLSIKHKYKRWRVGLSQAYIRDNDGNTGLANATLSAKYQWDFRPFQLELGVKQRLATANRNITLPVKDSGLFASANAMWHRTYVYADIGYWWREKADNSAQARKNSAIWGLGAFYPIKKSHWLGIGLDQSESVRLQNKETLLSIYWQAKLNSRYTINLATAKGLTKQSPDYFAGLQITRRF